MFKTEDGGYIKILRLEKLEVYEVQYSNPPAFHVLAFRYNQTGGDTLRRFDNKNDTQVFLDKFIKSYKLHDKEYSHV